MSKLDLNLPGDFARATMSGAGGLIQDLGLGGKAQPWELLEASYNGIKFHIFESQSRYQAALPQVQDVGGRRLVKYSFPYKDGQTTDDLGRKGYSFQAEVCLHGDRYLDGLKAILREFDKPVAGLLVHPVRGEFRARVSEFIQTYKNDERKAVRIQATFEEHNFSVGTIRTKDVTQNSLKDALAQATNAFQRIERVLAKFQAARNLVNSVRNRIETLISDYKGLYARAIGSINTAFNTGSIADLPAILPANRGGPLNQDGSISTSTFPLLVSPNDPYADVPLDDLAAQNQNPIGPIEAVQAVNTTREKLQEIITEVSSADVLTPEQLAADPVRAANYSPGSLSFYEELLELKLTAADLQRVLENALAASQLSKVKYVVPRTMSLREAAFINGIAMERVAEILNANPSLLSTNYIAKGTELEIPT